MPRAHSLMRLLSLAAVLLSGAASVYADGGEECYSKRPATPAERQSLEAIAAAMKRALPAAPADWKLVSLTDPGRPADSIFTRALCLESLSLKAIYKNDRNTLASAQSLKANSGRMDQIMQEFQAAAARGDTRRIQELNAEIARIQSGGAPGGTLSAITIEVNNGSAAGPDSKSQPISIPGAPLAYLNKAGHTPRVSIYLGESWQAQGTGAVLKLRREVPNTAAQLMVIRVEGGSAETFARLIDIGALKAVLR